MLILGIETSCDETSASVVKDGGEILSNIIVSQDEIHAPYGGVELYVFWNNKIGIEIK